MPVDKSSDLCPKCADLLIQGKLYCANCGLAVIAAPERVPIDAYIEAKVSQSMAARLVDQANLVREIGDKVEDVVWARLNRYKWILVVAGFLLGLYGITSINDAKTKIVEEAHTRLDPVITDTLTKVQTAQGEINTSESKIAALKTKLNDTSKLADEQNERLTVQGGEIDKKLQGVQEANRRASVLMSGFEMRASELEQSGRKVEAIQKSLESRIVAVTKQIDDVSVREAFPGLGQKLYVTYNNKPWRNPAEKKLNERWVNIYIDNQEWPSISPKQVENLGQALRNLGFIPLFGRFGLGGPYSSGFGPLGGYSTAIFYYDPKIEHDAVRAAQITKEALGLSEMPTQYIDPAKVDPTMRPVLLQSGLDMQIFITVRRQ